MLKALVDKASFIYEYKEQTGYPKKLKTWQMPVELSYFGFYKLVVIGGDCLLSNFPIETILSQFLRQYGLAPHQTIFLSQVRISPEIWEIIQFGKWDGWTLSHPMWQSIPNEIASLIKTGAILPGSYLAVLNNSNKESLTRQKRAKPI